MTLDEAPKKGQWARYKGSWGWVVYSYESVGGPFITVLSDWRGIKTTTADTSAITGEGHAAEVEAEENRTMSNFRIDNVISFGPAVAHLFDAKLQPVYNDDTQEFTLSTGTTFWSYTDMLGIGEDGGRLRFGSDGSVDVDFSPAERQEIADMMIARWERWKNAR